MKRILIVDDDLDTIGFLKIFLRQQGYQIFTAQDGHEALELLQTQSVDLILTDVAMPHLNGYELCQRIKNAPDPRLVLTPIILMSGRTLDSDIRYAKSLGADDYLPKPLDVDDLLAVVQGKLLAAWCLSGPVREDLPASLLADGGLAGLGLAEASYVGRRNAVRHVGELSRALAGAAASDARVEELSGQFLWYF